VEEDLNKARKIVRKRKRWVGSHGQLPENAAEAVAEGIALGRKEGLEMAAQAIKDQMGRLGRLPPLRSSGTFDVAFC
jgi:flagellar biosynthesis/type III secretory pathway protein FliH